MKKEKVIPKEDRHLVGELPIFNKWMALNLNKQGFDIIGIRENINQSGEIVFYFQKTPTILQAIQDEYDIIIR